MTRMRILHVNISPEDYSPLHIVKRAILWRRKEGQSPVTDRENSEGELKHSKVTFSKRKVSSVLSPQHSTSSQQHRVKVSRRLLGRSRFEHAPQTECGGPTRTTSADKAEAFRVLVRERGKTCTGTCVSDMDTLNSVMP